VLTPTDREFLDLKIAGKTPLERQFNEALQQYQWTCEQEGIQSDLLERTYAWIKANWPQQEGEYVLLWGDPRLANFMIKDYHVIAAFDWEMAGIGVPEQDVCWPVMFHGWQQDLTVKYGLTGMPNFMRLRKVVAQYEAVSGRKLNNLRFHLIFALGRLGPIMLRSILRAVKYGQKAMPETTDDLLVFRAGLEKLLDGETVWE
jgi:aminoglycoside phosphotransferase (APT) family kinase protein